MNTSNDDEDIIIMITIIIIIIIIIMRIIDAFPSICTTHHQSEADHIEDENAGTRHRQSIAGEYH